VIAIIALLLSVLMPALNKVRQQGRTLVCATRIRSINTGLFMYAGDSRGRYPAHEAYVPYMIWNRYGDNGKPEPKSLAYAMRDYVLSQQPLVAWCPLTDSQKWRPYYDPTGFTPDDDDIKFGKNFWVNLYGYSIGYSISQDRKVRGDGVSRAINTPIMSRSLQGQDRMLPLLTGTTHIPMEAAVNTGSQHSRPAGGQYPRDAKAPFMTNKIFKNMNTGYGDGHVETLRKLTNAICDNKWYYHYSKRESCHCSLPQQLREINCT